MSITNDYTLLKKKTFLKRNNQLSLRDDSQNWNRMWLCPVENMKQHSPDCQCLTGFLFLYSRTEDIDRLVIWVQEWYVHEVLCSWLVGKVLKFKKRKQGSVYNYFYFCTKLMQFNGPCEQDKAAWHELLVSVCHIIYFQAVCAGEVIICWKMEIGVAGCF